jgi:hypothetical protein
MFRATFTELGGQGELEKVESASYFSVIAKEG